MGESIFPIQVLVCFAATEPVADKQQEFIFYSSGGWEVHDQGTSRFGVW